MTNNNFHLTTALSSKSVSINLLTKHKKAMTTPSSGCVMTSGNLSSLPKPGDYSVIGWGFRRTCYRSIAVFPVPEFVAFNFVNISQFTFLHNDVHFAVFAKFIKYLVNPPDLFKGQLIQLQVGRKLVSAQRLLIFHGLLPGWVKQIK